MRETTDDYLNLITPYHAPRAKFRATVEANILPLVAVTAALKKLPSDFDIESAIGAQLDVVGEWVGRSRYVTIPVPDLWFTFDDLPRRGFDFGEWRGPYDPGTTKVRLDDATYRRLLYAKIGANNWNGETAQAVAILSEFFRRDNHKLFVEDRGDGHLAFCIAGSWPVLRDLCIFAEGYIPLKPLGMQVHYQVTSIENTPLFGFDVTNEYVAGFNIGSIGVTPQYLAHRIF